MPQEWWYEDSTDRLYQWYQNRWRFYIPVRRTRISSLRYRNQPQYMTADPVQYMKRARINSKGEWIWIQDVASVQTAVQVTQVPSETPASWQECIPVQYRWLVQNVTIAGLVTEILQELQEGRAKTVSDGSVKEGRGTAAWIIHTMKGSIRGWAHVTPTVGDCSSYRAEMFGIYGAIMTMYGITKFHNVTQFEAVVACDNSTAVQHCEWNNEPTCTHQEMDIMSALRKIRELSSGVYRFKWVRGHQQQGSTGYDEWAELNEMMDAKAKEVWELVPPADFKHYKLYGETWTVFTTGKITSNIDENLYEYVASPAILEYWEQDKGQSWQDVDIEAIRLTAKRLTHSKQAFVAKHLCNWCGVYSRRKLQREVHSATCPICSTVDETADHVLQCQDNRVQLVWDECMEKVKIKLKLL